MKKAINRAWCVTTKNGNLLYGEEACVYPTRKEAVKNKGSHEVRFCEVIIYLPKQTGASLGNREEGK